MNCDTPKPIVTDTPRIVATTPNTSTICPKMPFNTDQIEGLAQNGSSAACRACRRNRPMTNLSRHRLTMRETHSVQRSSDRQIAMPPHYLGQPRPKSPQGLTPRGTMARQWQRPSIQRQGPRQTSSRTMKNWKTRFPLLGVP